ncbi:MAG TPA: hypothetical protein VL137_00480 [Polyangiaceae bacterium]|nr:hypothetical protein [Polyangiaceae bacterium]
MMLRASSDSNQGADLSAVVQKWALRSAALGLTWLVVACGSGPEDPYIKTEGRSTRAIVSVQRSISADPAVPVGDAQLAPIGPSEPAVGNAHAMAHFVSLPQYTEPDRVLDWVGLHQSWPAVDTCVNPNIGEERVAPKEIDWKSLGNVELLEAGEVTIETARTSARLAPRAFPTISQLVSGVTYTTRDQSAEPLPPALPYRVHVDGSSVLPSLDLSATAPESLQSITVGGLPIDEASELHNGAPIDVTWLPASQPASSDLVVIELRDAAGANSVQCAFRDDAGVGTVPAERSKALSGRGQLLIHRVRRVREPLSAQGIAPGVSQIDFDFDVTRTVSYQAAAEGPVAADPAGLINPTK